MYMRVGATWYGLEALEEIDEARIDTLDPVKVAKALGRKGRFDPVNTKRLNTKSIGSRRKVSDEKNIIATYFQAIKPGADRRAFNKARLAWMRYKEKMNVEFQGMVKQLSAGEITKNQFMNSSRKLFKAGYEKAYRLGTDASGLDFIKLPTEDLAWLKRARQAEYKFLGGFAKDIQNKAGVIPYSSRAKMYIDTCDSIFDAGRVDAYPNEGTKVDWELGVAEHCPDCLDLAINSPYTPETLPTTPKAGATMCLTGCKCSLRVRYERPTEIPITVKPATADVVKKLGMVAVGVAAVNLTKAKDRRSDVPGRWDTVPEAEGLESATKYLDWNALDEMVSALLTLRLMEAGEPSAHKLNESRIALDKFVGASRKLPDWLDPFSREVYVWHAIGTLVLDSTKYGQRNEVRSCNATA